jgi:hypothetical protein
VPPVLVERRRTAELGGNRGADVQVPAGADASVWLGVGHSQLPEEDGRDVLRAPEFLRRRRRVTRRQEPRHRRVRRAEFEQLEPALAGQHLPREPIGRKLAEGVLRVGEGHQRDAVVAPGPSEDRASCEAAVKHGRAATVMIDVTH